MRLFSYKIVSIIFLNLIVSYAQAANTGLDVRIESMPPSITQSDDLIIQFTLENTSNDAVSVLTWNTPLEEGFNSNMFQVLRRGKTVEYLGRIIKRGTPKLKDYVTIDAGETISIPVNISEGYATYRQGSYDIAFKSTVLVFKHQQTTSFAQVFQTKQDEDDYQLIKLASNKVSAQRVQSIKRPFIRRLSLAPDYQSCNSSQQSSIASAATAAKNLASVAVQDLTTTTTDQRASAPRYVTWFGAYTSSRYSTVNSHYNKIKDALYNKQISFDCSCTEDYFAWVYPNRPYEIHLCNAFWSAPLTGTDSKAGTIVHELSHFNIVGGTDDHVYGHNGAKALARTNPDSAIDNADNTEYFAENTPGLIMGTGGGDGGGDGGNDGGNGNSNCAAGFLLKDFQHQAKWQQELRHFRDQTLQSSTTGQQLTALYYQHSKELNQLMANDKVLKRMGLRLLFRGMTGFNQEQSYRIVPLDDNHMQLALTFIERAQANGSDALKADFEEIKVILMTFHNLTWQALLQTMQ